MKQSCAISSSGLALLCVITLATTGCGSSTATVRVMNASPGEDSITASVGVTSVASSQAYATASAYTSVASGSETLQVNQATTSTSIVNQSISLTASTSYTILIANYSTSPAAVLLTDNNTAPATGNVNLRIIQAAPSLPSADIYVVAPGTSLTAVSPTISSQSFESASSYLPLTADSYEIYFTAPGQKASYIDSGPLTFTTGQVRSLVGLDGLSGGYTSTLLADLN